MDAVLDEVMRFCLGHGTLKCPFPMYKGELASKWMMGRHFRDLHLHPMELVVVKKEGMYSRCPRCGMQVDLRSTRHTSTQKSAGWGQQDATSWTWLPCTSNSWFMKMCLRGSRYSGTSATCSHRMTTEHGHFGKARGIPLRKYVP